MYSHNLQIFCNYVKVAYAGMWFMQYWSYKNIDDLHIKFSWEVPYFILQHDHNVMHADNSLYVQINIGPCFQAYT